LLSFHFKRHNPNKVDKTKCRNKLECEADLQCALSSTKPRIKPLISKKQLHTSQDNDKQLMFLCLLLRLGEAWVSTTNAKICATEQV